MTDTASVLEKLDLSTYVDVFIRNGFDTWEDVLDITESDLETLGVKIGHRRRLQREIANQKGISIDQVIASSERASSLEPGQGLEGEGRNVRSDNTQAGVTGKRRYRRHPRPDKNAPERPPSAYVLFSNQIREELKPQNLSFTDIAKIVGERWQQLDTNGREPYESQATSMKDEFNAKMADYKKTSEWREYQEYLATFKAQQAQSAGTSGGDGKRLKLERAGESSHGSSRGSAGTPSTSAHGSPISMTSSNIQAPPMPDPGPTSSLTSPTSSSSSSAFQPFHAQVASVRSSATPPGRPHVLGQPPGSETPIAYGSQPSLLPPLGDASRLQPRRSNNPAAPFLQHRDPYDASTSSLSSHQSSHSSGVFSPVTPVETPSYIPSRKSDGEHTPTFAQQSMHRLSIGSSGMKPPAAPSPIVGFGSPSALPSLGPDVGSRILPPPPPPQSSVVGTFPRASLSTMHEQPPRAIASGSSILQQPPQPTPPPPLAAPPSLQQPAPFGSRQPAQMDKMSVLAMASRLVDGGSEARKPKPP